MAPLQSPNNLFKRYYCYNYDYDDDCYSGWNSWGRWVALAVIVVVVLLLAFLFSCWNTRRRRRLGMAPMYGTGWMAGKPPYGQQQGNYYANGPYNNSAAPAPPYSTYPQVENQQTGNTFNSNEGYYGNHEQHNGYELQPPQHSYQPQRGGDSVYDAPNGAPPGKSDYVVR